MNKFSNVNYKFGMYSKMKIIQMFGNSLPQSFANENM